MTGIIDYGAGNITSVERTLSSIGAPFLTSKNPSDLENCDRIIFPGVGDAAFAMSRLKKTGFDLFLRECVLSDRKLMGICLGSQIVFDYSEEGNTECLGLIPGKIRHFSSLWKENGIDAEKNELKVPHIGYNDLSYVNGGSSAFEGISEKSDFYFVHSYVICPDDFSLVKAVCYYGVKVPSCVQMKNVFLFQFHPEKSGEKGIRILKNFIGEDLC